MRTVRKAEKRTDGRFFFLPDIIYSVLRLVQDTDNKVILFIDGISLGKNSLYIDRRFSAMIMS